MFICNFVFANQTGVDLQSALTKNESENRKRF